MTYTRAQVGAAFDPQTGDDAPITMAGVDQAGDELPAELPPLGSSRAFRLAGQLDAMAGPATTTEAAGLAAVHASGGQPDPRRSELEASGAPYGPELTELASEPEITSNTRTLVPMIPQNPPERPAAGFTGADPARPATTPRWLFSRLWDKWASEHPGVVDKVPQAPPVAAQPLAFADDVPGALPSPGGGFHNRREGTGGQPNTFRLMPRPWDELLISTGPPAAAGVDTAQATASAQAQKGWRAS